jgi:hypothetical protein
VKTCKRRRGLFRDCDDDDDDDDYGYNIDRYDNGWGGVAIFVCVS